MDRLARYFSIVNLLSVLSYFRTSSYPSAFAIVGTPLSQYYTLNGMIALSPSLKPCLSLGVVHARFKFGNQPGCCWISVVAGMRHWKLAASFPPTLCNQARRLFVQHATKQVLRLIACHLSVRYEEI
jgi:hypothetical protein